MECKKKVKKVVKRKNTRNPNKNVGVSSKNVGNEAGNEECPPKTFLRPSGRTLTWDNFLKYMPNLTKIPPVSFFKNAPVRDIWETIAIPGLVIELRNPFSDNQTEVYWVATIYHYAGYFALVKFENFQEKPFAWLSWISFVSNVPHPVGWAQENGKTLHPGKATAKSHPDYIAKLAEFLQGKPTVSSDHVQICKNSISSMISLDTDSGLPVEVVDFHSKKCQFRLGRISAISGDRVHVQYLDSDDSDSGFWLNSRSGQVYPLGFCHTVGGIQIAGLDSKSVIFPPLPLETFPEYPTEIRIKTNMFLELRHPLLPFKIVTGVIVKVLEYGYFILETCDLMLSDRCQYLFHVTSHFIFPYGWGQSRNIDVENYYTNVMWDKEYLELELLPVRQPHQFQVGMVLEACDLFDSSYIGAAKIVHVADHMLYIHFNHWSNQRKNFAWVDAENSSIYPIGYTELCGIQFQGHA